MRASLLLAHHPVSVRIPHELVGQVSPVDRCYAVGPGLGARDPAVLVVVPHREGAHVRWRRLILASQSVRAVCHIYADFYRLVTGC